MAEELIFSGWNSPNCPKEFKEEIKQLFQPEVLRKLYVQRNNQEFKLLHQNINSLDIEEHVKNFFKNFNDINSVDQKKDDKNLKEKTENSSKQNRTKAIKKQKKSKIQQEEKQKNEKVVLKSFQNTNWKETDV